MSEMDIQFYGERGIVNGILLDIYRDDTPKDKLDKFFGAIKLMDGSPLPWENGIDSCKWMVEPSFAQFGDPDLIAVIESGGETYALFIEAKLKDYVSSCMSLQREDGIDNLKGQSSKLNVQLSFRYRFVQAFKEAQKDASKIIIERHGEYPDRQQRKLQKEPVVDSISSFLEGVKKDNFYFIALTNDVSPENGLVNMSGNYCPPLTLTLTLKNGTCNEFVNNKSKFGILTYRVLVANDVVKYDEKEKEGLGFFHKACKMMGVKVPTENNTGNNKEIKTNNPPRIKSININDWGEWQRVAEKFVNNKSLEFSFIKRNGSYSLELGNAVVMKLMLVKQNEKDAQNGTDDKLMLGFLDSSVFDDETPPTALTVGVGERGKTFYFCPVEEHNIEKMIKLANKYYKSLIRPSESVDYWKAIPDEGIKGMLSGLQYNTGPWMSQVVADSTEDIQESNDMIPPSNELRLLIVTEDKKDLEVVMENLSALSLHALSSVQKIHLQQVHCSTGNKGDKLHFVLETNTFENRQQSPEHNIIASSWGAKWREIN